LSDTTSTFSTAPVAMIGTYPTVPLRPDSPFVVEFDQDVDPAAISKLLSVDTAKQKLAFQLTTLDAARATWAKNPAIKFNPKDLAAHYVVLAPKTTWPAGTELRVKLAKNAPSREGPRLSAREQVEAVTIARPFVVRGITCDDKFDARMTQV